MATLNVTFKGIGTHFRDVVPGVRHRSVLPTQPPCGSDTCICRFSTASTRRTTAFLTFRCF